jgi:hypothetical protein
MQESSHVLDHQSENLKLKSGEKFLAFEILLTNFPALWICGLITLSGCALVLPHVSVKSIGRELIYCYLFAIPNPKDVFFHVIDHQILVSDQKLYNIANANQANHLTILQYWQMPNSLVGHQCHTLINRHIR